MFAIYADDELEKKQQMKKPEDYVVKNPVAKIIFEAGCDLVKEESEKRVVLSAARQERFKAIHPQLRDVRICKQRGE